MWDDSYKKSEMYINTDTYYMKHTYAAAQAAVKTVLIATKAILKKAINMHMQLLDHLGITVVSRHNLMDSLSSTT
uniref:Uncharacterized protein n=1 Tax=Nymphaea colorata TaxID=210225 RepID=A0A5K1HNA8_9MAGN|nr:unnamed protein product [Nymphaea colorata]